MTQLDKTNRVIVYYDETKDVPSENLKGHVLLFVPEQLQVSQNTPLFGPSQDTSSPSTLFFEHMMRIREERHCNRKFHFSGLSGRKWIEPDQALFEVVTLAVEAMRTKGVRPPLKQPLAFKLAVMFYPKGADLTLYGGDTRKEKRLRHDETILRILLKGAAHYLYSDENRIEILHVICDGYPEHRPFNEERILWQLTIEESRGRAPLRDYVTIHPSATIIQLSSDHKDHEPDSSEYMHANLLQVADLLLGAVRHLYFVGIHDVTRIPRIGEKYDNKRSIASSPVLEMLDKVERGKGFKRSGHYRTFTISQVEFQDGQITFKQPNTDNIQSGIKMVELPFDGS